jgi:Amidase
LRICGPKFPNSDGHWPNTIRDSRVNLIMVTTRALVPLLVFTTAAFYALWTFAPMASISAEPELDLLTATVGDIVVKLKSGAITSEFLIKSYLDRIDRNNYRGLNLRAVLEITPFDSLIAQAQLYDLERQSGISRGALHRVPILVKDNIATHPELGMNTTAGSFALCNSLMDNVNPSG